MKIKPAVFVQNAVKRTIKRLDGHFYDHKGLRRCPPLFADRNDAAEAAPAVERLVNIRASGNIIPNELQEVIEVARPQLRDRLAARGIIDPSRVAAVHLLLDHVADLEKFILSAGNDPEYVKLKTGRVRALFNARGFVQWSDFRAEVVSDQLLKLSGSKRRDRESARARRKTRRKRLLLFPSRPSSRHRASRSLRVTNDKNRSV